MRSYLAKFWAFEPVDLRARTAVPTVLLPQAQARLMKGFLPGVASIGGIYMMLRMVCRSLWICKTVEVPGAVDLWFCGAAAAGVGCLVFRR